MDVFQRSLELHKIHKGKLAIESKVQVNNREDLSLAYTPGVAEPCRQIHENPAKVYEYTSKGNLVAVVSDGTAVLGLGDIGPAGAMPVMEGKAILFKTFADIDAFPICLDTKNVDEIVNTVRFLSPTFGGINLEDISAPRCFEIEERLKKELDIPVFHDDQHGTAIVVLAGLINALKLADKSLEDIKVVINGVGSAGIAIAKLILSVGVKNILLVDRKGIVYRDNPENNKYKELMAEVTNPKDIRGSLQVAMKDSDVFIGVSAPGTVTKEMIKSMNSRAIVFAMANPVPEIMPQEAIEAGAFIVGTGRSDFPNQINNVLAFPGVFRGALDVGARDINEEMKIAAAYAIADIIEEKDLTPEFIIPDTFDKLVVERVSRAVAIKAQETGVARLMEE